MIAHVEVLLNGHPYTDLGWQLRTADLVPYAGRTVRLHIREFIPETFTGPANIEFDAFRIDASNAPQQAQTRLPKLRNHTFIFWKRV